MLCAVTAERHVKETGVLIVNNTVFLGHAGS